MARRTDSVSLWDKGCYKNSFCVSEWPGLTDAIERGGWAVKAGSRKATVKHHGNRHALKNSLLGLPSLRSEAVGYRSCFWGAGSRLMTLRYRSFRLKLCMVFSCFVFSKNEVTQWWCHPHTWSTFTRTVLSRMWSLAEIFSMREWGSWQSPKPAESWGNIVQSLHFHAPEIDWKHTRKQKCLFMVGTEWVQCS